MTSTSSIYGIKTFRGNELTNRLQTFRAGEQRQSADLSVHKFHPKQLLD